VPLYRVRYALRGDLPKKGVDFDPEALFERHWFSDGGISSNFPVHFFGTWLPDHPTFGIDLTEMPDEAFHVNGAATRETGSTMLLRPEFVGGRVEPDEGQEAVVLPVANRVLHPEWVPIRGLRSFLGSIWETSHSYRDNMVMALPSFRDRVARVRFASGEGGLNLSMSQTAIASIREKGKIAGEMLRDQFDFDEQRWVHYLVLMADLEEGLNQMAQTLREDPALLDRFVGRACTPPYGRKEDWIREAVRRTREIQALVETWRELEGLKGDAYKPSSFFRDAPRPTPELRLSPKY